MDGRVRPVTWGDKAHDLEGHDSREHGMNKYCNSPSFVVDHNHNPRKRKEKKEKNECDNVLKKNVRNGVERDRFLIGTNEYHCVRVYPPLP